MVTVPVTHDCMRAESGVEGIEKKGKKRENNQLRRETIEVVWRWKA